MLNKHSFSIFLLITVKKQLVIYDFLCLICNFLVFRRWKFSHLGIITLKTSLIRSNILTVILINDIASFLSLFGHPHLFSSPYKWQRNCVIWQRHLLWSSGIKGPALVEPYRLRIVIPDWIPISFLVSSCNWWPILYRITHLSSNRWCMAYKSL